MGDLIKQELSGAKARQALIFDFDGLILDTESAQVDLYSDRFEKAGLHFDFEAYRKILGTDGADGYLPWEVYARESGEGRSVDEVHAWLMHDLEEQLKHTPPMDGVLAQMAEARKRGILLAVGSSSDQDWVHTKLGYLGLRHSFDIIVTRNDVTAGKPSPEIFLKVLEALQVRPENALVLEDSRNGCIAAHRAGIRVVQVPNAITKLEKTDSADEVLSSLTELNLDKYF